jgi:hypothetical protein
VPAHRRLPERVPRRLPMRSCRRPEKIGDFSLFSTDFALRPCRAGGERGEDGP